MRLAMSRRCGFELHAQQPTRSSAPTFRLEWTATLRAAFDQLFGEERARIAVVERAVDMGGGDGDQARRTHQPGGLGDDSHRHRCAIAARAGGQRLLVRRQELTFRLRSLLLGSFCRDRLMRQIAAASYIPLDRSPRDCGARRDVM